MEKLLSAGSLSFIVMGGCLFLCAEIITNKTAKKIMQAEAVHEKERLKKYVKAVLTGSVAALLCIEKSKGCGYSFNEMKIKDMVQLLCLSGFFLMARTDMKTLHIPNWQIIVSMALTAICSLYMPELSMAEHVAGLLCVSFPMALIMLFKHEAFGGGDIKLMAAIGLIIGYKYCLAAFIAALLLGSIYAVRFLLTKKKAVFAFGPFLCTGISAALVMGEQLIEIFEL